MDARPGAGLCGQRQLHAAGRIRRLAPLRPRRADAGRSQRQRHAGGTFLVMSFVVTISASPLQASRTQLLAAQVGAAVAARGIAVETINVRDLPAEDLLWGRTDAPVIRRALDLIARASGVVVATPVYKAAYTGVLKTFLDLLPQFGLQGK